MSFLMEDIVMDENVEFLIEEEANVDEAENDVGEESILLLVEDCNLESNVDTFSCGTCKCTWNELSTFLEHKNTFCCPEQILEVDNDNDEDDEEDEDVVLQPETSQEVHFDDAAEVFTLEQVFSENSSKENVEFVVNLEDNDVENVFENDVGNENVIFQLEETEEEPVSNRPPNFPLEVDEDGDEPRHRLACSVCDRIFSKKYDLEAHLRCHTGEKPYRCPICAKGFTQNSNMKKHLNTHKVWLENIRKSPKANPNVLTEVVTTKGRQIQVVVHKTYECKFCPAVLQGYLQFRCHMKTHAHLKGFHCPRCTSTFLEADQLLSHLTDHDQDHDQDQSQEPILLNHHCNECAASFDSQEELAFHKITGSHLEEPSSPQEQVQPESEDPPAVEPQRPEKHLFILRCNKCNLAFESKTEEADHECAEAQLSCQLCGKTFSSADRLDFHLSAHKKRKKAKKTSLLKCQNCKMTFATAKSRDQHSLTSSCNPSSCDVCRKTFSDERYLRRHLKRFHSSTSTINSETSNSAKVICPICDKTFSNNQSLRSHTLIHTGDLPFSCDFEQCSKSFNRSDKLKRHKLTHIQDSEKKFFCPFSKHTGCNKVFHRFDKLKEHVRIHGNNKISSKCRICQLEFSCSKDLKLHLDQVHGENNQLRCSECDLTFKWEKSRTKHLSEVHGIVHIDDKDEIYLMVTSENDAAI